MTNISNKKIFSIANRFVSSIPNDLTPNEVFDYIKGKTNNQMMEYFYALGPHAYLKTIIAIWAIKSGKSENEIINIYNNLFFTLLISKLDEKYTPDCDNCEGTGDIDCSDCNRGTIECPDCRGEGEDVCGTCGGDGGIRELGDCESCDGSGMVDDDEICDDCRGSGEVMTKYDCDDCGGSGEIPCDRCGGDGELTCRVCHGNGHERCKECDGYGYIVTEENLINVMLVCSWDKKLYELCELEEGTHEPILDEVGLYRVDNKILLFVDDRYHFDLIDDVEESEVYCVKLYNDYPELFISNRLNFVDTLFNEKYITHLLK